MCKIFLTYCSAVSSPEDGNRLSETSRNTSIKGILLCSVAVYSEIGCDVSDNINFR
jgi:hypothetical protein